MGKISCPPKYKPWTPIKIPPDNIFSAAPALLVELLAHASGII
jgi:hypothetical protein